VSRGTVPQPRSDATGSMWHMMLSAHFIEQFSCSRNISFPDLTKFIQQCYSWYCASKTANVRNWHWYNRTLLYQLYTEALSVIVLTVLSSRHPEFLISVDCVSVKYRPITIQDKSAAISGIHWYNSGKVRTAMLLWAFNFVVHQRFNHLEQTTQVSSFPLVYTEHGSVPQWTSTG